MFTDNIKDMGTNEDNYNVTILIAEDEESNFLLLKTILKRHCNVLQARTGLELLKVFAEKGADLILLDIKMPEMNGIEALKEIRKKDTNIPIIMQSAYAFENDMEAARAAGSNGFITKPINIVELKSRHIIKKWNSHNDCYGYSIFLLFHRHLNQQTLPFIFIKNLSFYGDIRINFLYKLLPNKTLNLRFKRWVKLFFTRKTIPDRH